MPKQHTRYRLAAAALFLLLALCPAGAQTARERHERIRTAVESGDYAAAVQELQALEASDPRAFALNNYDYLLARVSERLGNAAVAQSRYQRIVARNSPLAEYALWHMAEMARSTGNLTLEREKLRQLLATAPASLLRDAASARLGESFFESRDYQSAINALRPRASARGNASAREALSLVAQAYHLSNQKEAARDAFSSLIDETPDASQPDDFALAGARGLDALDGGSETAAPQLAEGEHLRRAKIYNFNRDFAGARRHYAAVLERYAGSANAPEALYMIGRGFYQERNFSEAVKYFQRVVKEFTESANARDALSFTAASFARTKQYDEAVAAYQSVIARYGTGSTLERAYLNIIDVLRDAGRDADALSWVEQTRSRFKGQTAALALFSQARIHLAQNDWGKALADFDALSKEPDTGGANTSGSTNPTEIAFMRAYALEQLGRTDEAVNAYLAIPDGRGQYYGGRATRRLRALATNEKTRDALRSRAGSLSAEAQKAIATREFDAARRAAQTALRLTEDETLRNALLEIARRAYSGLPDYSSPPAGQLVPVGRQTVLAQGQSNPNVHPSRRALADELLFLGLYDEGAPELAAAGDSAPAEKRDAAAALSHDEAYTLAVLFKRGDNASHAVRYSEPLWKRVPADYLLELAPREAVELLYPAPYRDALLEYAPPRGVDPRFVHAIMRQESRFKPEAKSNAAARGLLQFIPSTADEMAGLLGLSDFRQDELYSPRVAVLFGSEYMGKLFREFPEMPQAVAASYNGGEDNVARWVARARSNDPDRYVLEIAFSQSKEYVYRVLPNYWVYQTLYTDQLKRR